MVAPRWISGSDVFWYRRDGAGGPEYVIVDAQTGAKTPAFDMGRLVAAASQAAGGVLLEPRDLSVVKIDGASDARNVVLAQRGRGRFTCALPGYGCTFTAAVEMPADARRSPDQSQAVFARDDDLWIRDLKSGTERRLTTDGQPYFSYGKQPDSSLVALPRLRSPAASPPWGISWSPNGHTLVGVRIDERSVAPYPYVEWVPQDGSFRPITYQLRLPLLGDPPPPHDTFLLDVASATKQEIKLPAGWSFASIAWSSDGRRMFGLAWSFGVRDAALVEVDVSTGETRTVVKESSPTSLSFNTFVYNIANVRILGGGREAVWWSERDGWGHLYLYDIATGELKRQITSGPWLVRDIIRVDQDRREIYFTATGREPGEDPYYRHLYRVSLDGGTPTDLTPGAADHAFEAPLTGFAAAFLGGAIDDGQKVSPSGRYVVDTTTTVDKPPVTVLRATDSTDVVTTLEQADASAVFAAGWHAPERLLVKAADGRTDISAVVYLPPDYAPGRHYPVIDAFYGGPQMINAPRSFEEAIATFDPVSRASLAQLGFIVVTIDARGTPGRSKAFHDVGYGDWADPQIDDHIAAIKQLAEKYGTFDLDRVGVYGHSYGGYTSARAILSHPEFYKVAVSSAGSHNYQGFYQGHEAFNGIPDYGDGVSIRPNPQAIPEAYKRLDNASLAAKFSGHLLLVYGDMDENALPAVTLQLADALEKANKSFDLLYLPNRTHSFFRNDPYYVRRMWDYFVEHLAGLQPPPDYDLKFTTKAG